MEINIEQFKKKADLCLKEYSTTKALLMLQSVCDSQGVTPQQINTVGKLRHIVETNQSKSKPVPCLTYCLWMIDTLKYIRQLKSTYRDLVLENLLDRAEAMNGSLTLDTRSATESSIDLNKSSDHILSYEKDIPEIKELFNHQEYTNIAKRLKYISQRLDLLLEEEGSINPDMFSWKSLEYSLKAGELAEGLNNIIRLIPDCLIKCQTMASLSQRLYVLDERQQMEGDERLEKLARVHTFLADKLMQVTEDVYVSESRLEEETESLQNLVELENMTNSITTQHRNAERKMQALDVKIARLRREIEDTRDLVQTTTETNRSFHRDLLRDLKKKRSNLDLLVSNRRAVEYQVRILYEDLTLQLELKPSIIRYTDSLQEQCDSLESELQAKKEEKYQLEEAMTPINLDITSQKDAISRSANGSSASAGSANSATRTPSGESIKEISAVTTAANDRSMSRNSANDRTASRTSANGKSTTKTPANERTVSRTSVNERAASKTPGNERSASRTSANNRTASRHSASERPAYGTPFTERPASISSAESDTKNEPDPVIRSDTFVTESKTSLQ